MLFLHLLCPTAYVVVGEEKHTGTQDAGRGASKIRLGQSVKTWLAQWREFSPFLLSFFAFETVD